MTDGAGAPAFPDATTRSNTLDIAAVRRAATFTALAGIAHATLFLVSIALLDSVPSASASDAEILAFYASPARRSLVLVGLYVMPFAAIAFMWFIVALRGWVRARATSKRDELSAELQLVAGALYLALFLVAAAALSSTAATIDFSGGDIRALDARVLPGFGATLLTVMAMRMAAVFVISTTNVARRISDFPRWMTVFGFAVGIFLLLSVSLAPALVIAFPLWIIALSLLLFQRARRIRLPFAAAG